MEFKIYSKADSQSNPAFFQMPVEIKTGFSGGGDTTIGRVMNTVNNQLFTLHSADCL